MKSKSFPFQLVEYLWNNKSDLIVSKEICIVSVNQLTLVNLTVNPFSHQLSKDKLNHAIDLTPTLKIDCYYLPPLAYLPFVNRAGHSLLFYSTLLIKINCKYCWVKLKPLMLKL